MKARLQQHVSLAPWTTFQVGGPARYFFDASSEADIREALDFADEHQLPLFVLGGGSNLLVADAGFPGLVLHVGLKGIRWDTSSDRTEVRAAAGEDWDSLVAACVERGLCGIECLSGIPGLAGGTPVQNVGAYGQETSDVLEAVRVMERSSGRTITLTKEQCGFGYRRSIFNTSHRDRYIVTEISYTLQPGKVPGLRYADLVRYFEKQNKPVTLLEVREAVRHIRAGKGMLIVNGDPDCRSAGSFFKNPIISEEEYAQLAGLVGEGATPPRFPAAQGSVKTSAAWLIEHAGFHKGYTLGPAGISSKHTLAIVNRGGARAADLLQLARTIQRGVEDRFGIRLLPEPVLVGFGEEEGMARAGLAL